MLVLFYDEMNLVHSMGGKWIIYRHLLYIPNICVHVRVTVGNVRNIFNCTSYTCIRLHVNEMMEFMSILTSTYCCLIIR